MFLTVNIFLQKSDEVKKAAEEGRAPVVGRTQVTCRTCKAAGHNSRTCPMKVRFASLHLPLHLHHYIQFNDYICHYRMHKKMLIRVSLLVMMLEMDHPQRQRQHHLQKMETVIHHLQKMQMQVSSKVAVQKGCLSDLKHSLGEAEK